MERDEERLVRLLKEKGYHITFAESCTGGLLAGCLVSVAGASAVFEEGYVTYSDRVKEKVLGVSRQTLEMETAVSAQTAREMALGAAQKTGAQLAVSVTGYAGPDDAADGTRAGTVYIGVCFLNRVQAQKFVFDGDRACVREKSVKEAVRMALSVLA